MPGGEGPEGDAVWAEGDLSAAGRAAHDLRRGGPAETPAQTAIASGQASAAIAISGQPEMAEAVTAGAIPVELDMRPKPDQATPNPFLDREMLPRRPAWDPEVVTATRLPDAKKKPRRRSGPGFFR